MSSTVVPEVTWAQRSSSSNAEKNYIFLTIVATDVPESDKKLDLTAQKLSFQGTSTSKKLTYAIDLEFYAEIDPKESKIHHTGRDFELVLRKKELKEEYWPRLLKDSKKVHFLKTNFDKWVDDDEQDEAPEIDDDYMSKMNPMGAGAGGADGGFGGIDFSKLGAQGAGGLPGMEGLGNLDGGESSGDEDDDDMPALEKEEPKAETSSGKKIEEVN